MVRSPAAHVDHGEHVTEAASFSVWYVGAAHAVQLVVFVAKAKPAGHKPQAVPVNEVSDWYVPSAQLSHSRFNDKVGTEPYVPSVHTDQGEQVTDAAALLDW